MLIKDIAKFNPKGRKSKEYINYVDTASVEDGKLIDVQMLFSDYPSRAQRVISKEMRRIDKHNISIMIFVKIVWSTAVFLEK